MGRILFLFFVWSVILENIFVRRDYLKNKVLKVENDVMNVCYYCNYCKRSEKFYSLGNELKKKDFNSFNKNVPFWNVYKDLLRIEPLRLDLQILKVFFFFFLNLVNLLAFLKRAT